MTKKKKPKVQFGQTPPIVRQAAAFLKSSGTSDHNPEIVANRFAADEIISTEQARRFKILYDRYAIASDDTFGMFKLALNLANEFVDGFDPKKPLPGRPLKKDKAGTPDLVLAVHELMRKHSLSVKDACRRLSRRKGLWYRLKVTSLQARYNERKGLYDHGSEKVVCKGCGEAFGRDAFDNDDTHNAT